MALFSCFIMETCWVVLWDLCLSRLKWPEMHSRYIFVGYINFLCCIDLSFQIIVETFIITFQRDVPSVGRLGETACHFVVCVIDNYPPIASSVELSVTRDYRVNDDVFVEVASELLFDEFTVPCWDARVRHCWCLVGSAFSRVGCLILVSGGDPLMVVPLVFRHNMIRMSPTFLCCHAIRWSMRTTI